MAEFTGERVVPGEVNPDLWNEHRSRYLFASRLARGKRVLDVGCGTGYGASELAKAADWVVGLDLAPEAVDFAAEHYTVSNLAWLQANAGSIPLSTGAFDLIVAFEIIEHLADPEPLLEEAARLLAPGGQFIVSTPNRRFYAESRRLSGPNPFHEREYEFEEYREMLRKRFAHVSLFVQNHGPCLMFQPVQKPTGADVRVESELTETAEANFFVAVCAAVPQTGAPTFVHVPSSANLLHERSEHIRLLEDELKTKDRWIEEAREDLDRARVEIDRLNTELAAKAVSYEAKITDLEQENENRTQWALDSRAELDRKIEELSDCVEVLHRTEKILEERTAWAQELEWSLREVSSSTWVKIGKAFGVVSRLRQK